MLHLQNESKLSLGTQFLSIVLLMSAMESGGTTLAISNPGTLRVDGTHYWLVVNPNGQIVESGQEATSATDCKITEW